MTPAALWTMVVMAGCAGWTAALAVEGVPPIYLALVAGLAVVEMETFRRLDTVRGRLMAAGELAGLLVIAVGSYLVVSLISPAPISSALAGIIAAFLIWLFASITATDLEAVVEPTDVIGGLSGPAGRLAGRMLLIGLVLTIAVVVANGTLAPPAEPRPLRAALVVPYVVYWLFGVAALSGIHRSKNLATWRRDQAHIDPDLGSRWSGASGLWLIAAVTITASLWWAGRRVLSVAHALTAGAVSAVTGWLTDLLNPDRSSPRNQVLPSVGATMPEPAEPSRLIGPAPAWWDAFLLVAAGLVFAYAYILVIRRSRRTRAAPTVKNLWLSTFLSLFAAIGAVLAGLWRALLGLRHRRGHISVDRQRSAPSTSRVPWVPPDEVRRRIADDYRTFVRAATDGVGLPHAAETPSEYGKRVSGTLDDEPAIGQLSDLYAEARFSVHQLSDDDAGRAELWREQIVDRLEHTDNESSGVDSLN